MVILPVFIDLDKYPFQEINEYLYDIFKKEEIDYVDVTGAFKEIKDRKLWILPYDQHPNEAAHGIIADKLSEKIVNDYPDIFKTLKGNR